jgi:HEPN domain-containing protein
MKPEAQAWLTIAREDMAAAELLLERNLHRMVCLHSQQAVEKTLKALLTECGVEFKRTHNIVDLLFLLTAQGVAVDVSHEEAGFLNAVYRSRYPAEAGTAPQRRTNGRGRRERIRSCQESGGAGAKVVRTARITNLSWLPVLHEHRMGCFEPRF